MKQNKQADIRRLATVVADSYDAITVQDLDGRILAWNRGAERMYGYTEAEALGMNIAEIVASEKQDEAAAFIERVKLREPVESFETLRVTRDGRVLNVWLTVTELVDDDGNVNAIATTERDITERKLREKELLQTISELRKALEEVRTLRGFLPICASCKKIRDDTGYWQQIEFYIREHTEADFTHGICPDCATALKQSYSERSKKTEGN